MFPRAVVAYSCRRLCGVLMLMAYLTTTASLFAQSRPSHKESRVTFLCDEGVSVRVSLGHRIVVQGLRYCTFCFEKIQSMHCVHVVD